MSCVGSASAEGGNAPDEPIGSISDDQGEGQCPGTGLPLKVGGNDRRKFRGAIFAPQPVMIQRKQTLFLALAALCVGLMFVFAIATYDHPNRGSTAFKVLGPQIVDPDSPVSLKPLVPLAGLSGFAILLLVATIFFYKDRQRQLRFASFCYMVLLALFAAVFMSQNSMSTYFGMKSSQYQGHIGIAYFLPLVALVFTFLAVRGIKADEELVKSADRLR